MFDMTQFLKDNLIRGYFDGSFSETQVSIFAANYIIKGWFTEDDLQEVLDAIHNPPIEEETEEDSIIEEPIEEENTDNENVN